MSQTVQNERQHEALYMAPMEPIQDRYAQEVVMMLSDLQRRLNSIHDPQKSAYETLKIACKFYHGDWAGILQVDFELEVWKPIWWYNCNAPDTTSKLVHEVESSKSMSRWIECFKSNQALYLADTSFLCENSPSEYEVYERLNIRSFLAVPLNPRMCGFLVVRNPQRYSEHSNMLQILSYAANNAVNEYRMLELEEFALVHPEIKHPDDVVVNLFGELEIYTCKGVLKQNDLHSLKLNWLLVYLLLEPNRAHPSVEIFEALGAGQNRGSPLTAESIRTLVYRFRNKFGGLLEKELIVTSPNGYQINPSLRIKSDLMKFEQLSKIAKSSNHSDEKIEVIKKALELYKGPVYAAASSELWLFHTVNHYAMGYIEMVNRLLELLAHYNDYESLNHYASVALRIDSGNMTSYFWRIYSMYRTGAVERLQRVLEQAKKDLTSEEYENLLQKVYSNGDQNLIGLMQ